VDEILELATQAGARTIGGVALHLRGEVRDIFFDWLRQHRPDLVPRYEELYRRGAYMRSDERDRLASMARIGKGVRGTRRVRRTDGDKPPKGAVSPPPERQTSLF
jgi:DNA repair photolyase